MLERSDDPVRDAERFAEENGAPALYDVELMVAVHLAVPGYDPEDAKSRAVEDFAVRNGGVLELIDSDYKVGNIENITKGDILS